MNQFNFAHGEVYVEEKHKVGDYKRYKLLVVVLSRVVDVMQVVGV